MEMNENELLILWRKIYTRLEERYSPAMINLYFSNDKMQLCFGDDERLIFRVKSDHKRDLLERRYTDMMTSLVQEVTGKRYGVSFISDQKKKLDPQIESITINGSIRGDTTQFYFPADSPTEGRIVGADKNDSPDEREYFYNLRAEAAERLAMSPDKGNIERIIRRDRKGITDSPKLPNASDIRSEDAPGLYGGVSLPEEGEIPHVSADGGTESASCSHRAVYPDINWLGSEADGESAEKSLGGDRGENVKKGGGRALAAPLSEESASTAADVHTYETPAGTYSSGGAGSSGEFTQRDPAIMMGKGIFEFSFDTFIVGDSNNFAFSACKAVAERQTNYYNPLFIHGASGLGKTHLLYAVIRTLKLGEPNTRIVYVKGDDFTNQLIECIRTGKMPSFRERYRRADVLLIDDIQFIAGKGTSEEELFNTFNSLYEQQKQIVLTSDRPPHEIRQLADRLRSRFEGGLIVDIKPPNFELRTAILQDKAAKLGFTLPQDVLTFLANNLKSNVRQLEGSVRKLGAQSFLTGKEISVDLAVACVADLLSSSEPVRITVERILEEVSSRYGITVDQLRSKGRKKEIASARHVAIWLIREMTDLSISAIGRELSRDHTTILSSLNSTENELKNPASPISADITELRKRLQ